MSKQVAVIGLGRFGTSLAITLHDAGYDVLAIDKVSDLVDAISPHVTRAVRVNAVNELALQKLGISSFDVAVVAVGASVEDSAMITILLKRLGVRYIVARADNELHGAILESIGANKVIFPERDVALRTGPILTMQDVSDFIPLDSGAGIAKAKAPVHFVGKTLADIGFGSAAKSGVIVLMIQRGKEALVCPDVKEVVSHVDVLVMARNNKDMDKLLEHVDSPDEAKKRKSD